jgi:signal transduction histidine kinase
MSPQGRRLSLRWRLSLAYAGIALLTAVVLGAIMLTVLSGFFVRSETAYLEASAHRVLNDVTEMTRNGQQPTVAQLQGPAFVTQSRVRVLDADGEVLVDSGSPDDIDPSAIGGGPQLGQPQPRAPVPNAPPRDPQQPVPRTRQPLPNPLGRGLFGQPGDAATERSDRSIQRAIYDANRQVTGYVEVSEPPAYGRDALVSVAQAWTLAGLAAVALSALAGWVLSTRMSSPLRKLTAASDRMAAGDLSARAEVNGSDEFGRLGSSFDQMADRIQRTVTTLRRFVADAAHEVGTPLTALQADLELAEKRAADDQERQLVTRALGQARRLEDLSAGLLELSRLEAGQQPEPAQRLELTSLVRHAADAAASRAEQADVGFVLRADDPSINVQADPARLTVAIDNLLDNALKFTPKGGSVTLGVRREGPDAVISVEDTGIGIPQEDLPDLFERFHRSGNAAGYPGSGLGLAIVKAVAETSGGGVDIRSGEDGTVAELRLPTV